MGSDKASVPQGYVETADSTTDESSDITRGSSGLASQVRLLPGERHSRSGAVSDSEVYAGKPAECAQCGAHRAEIEAMRHDWTADSLAWEAERDERREQVARVEALAKWLERWPSGPSFAVVAREIRAALAGPAPVEQQVQS